MKILKLSEELIQSKIQEVMSKYSTGQSTATINFDNMLKLEDPKVKLEVAFTQTAWDKMHAIVKQCDAECAWHGIVAATDKGYKITDILIYPQNITSVTVESDDERYNPWLMSLTDDQINNMRMQGHSHVNMGVSPSATDKAFYSTMLHHVNDFYIFLIVNKKQEIFCEVYDVTNNVVYENKDCVVRYPAGQMKWADEQLKEMVIKRTSVVTLPNTTTTTTTTSSTTAPTRRTTPWYEDMPVSNENIRSMQNWGTDTKGAYYFDSTGEKVYY